MGRIIKNTIFTLVFLTLSASTAILAYLHFTASKDEDISGEWTAYLDMTEQASAIAYSWLQDIEAVSVSLEDMESYMQDLTVSVYLTLDEANPSGELSDALSCRKAMMPVNRRPMRHLPRPFRRYWPRGFVWQVMKETWIREPSKLL